MGIIICKVDDVLHRKFKMMCIVKGISMKAQLTKFVTFFIRCSGNKMNVEDLITALVQEERKDVWEKAVKDYNAKMDIKRIIRQQAKDRQLKKLEKERKKLWIDTQELYKSSKRKIDTWELQAVYLNYENKILDETFEGRSEALYEKCCKSASKELGMSLWRFQKYVGLKFNDNIYGYELVMRKD